MYNIERFLSSETSSLQEENRVTEESDNFDDELLMETHIPAKVSGLAWEENCSNVLSCVDYDGIFSRLDVATGKIITEGDSHNGRRIWSLRCGQEFSGYRNKYITASEDGTCGIWEGDCEAAVLKIEPEQTGHHRSSCCSAEFLSNDKPLIIMALSDSSIQVFDLRYKGRVGGWYAHSGPVSGLRIAGSTMVSSSTDSSAALWDLNNCVETPKIIRRFRGHVNTRNFVGLSLRKDGFVACGSEIGDFYTYYKNWEMPISRQLIKSNRNGHGVPKTYEISSALSWHPCDCHQILFSGSSTGGIHAYKHIQVN